MNQGTDTNKKNNMRKVALTALAGTSIEWYDFFLYGAAAALIFPSAFFGEVNETTALILSLLTFAAGFIARPIGGIIFGHFGDKIGRKKNTYKCFNVDGDFFNPNRIIANLCHDWSYCSNITYIT